MIASRRKTTRWRSPRLWLRLAFGFGLLVGLMLIVVAIAVTQFRSLAHQAEQLARDDLQRMLAVQGIHHHAQGHGNAMARLMNASRSERVALNLAVAGEYQTVRRLLAGLSAPAADDESNHWLQQVADRREAYDRVVAEVLGTLDDGDAEAARSLFAGSGQPALRELIDAASALLIHEQVAVQQRRLQTQQQIRQSEWLLAALAVCALVLAGQIGWRISMSVVRPLQRIEQAANQIAEGDYSVRFQARAGDELDKVAAALNAMSAAVAAREARIEELAFTESRTGLPNRTRLRREFDGRGAQRLSALLMDVARMRSVNEILGFETGDALLAAIADRLRRVVSTGAASDSGRMLAALGGGVFAVICSEHERPALEQLRQQIDIAMAVPVVCNGSDVDVQFVYGMSDGRHGIAAGVDAALRHAEAALGQAKQTKSRWCWHVPIDESARARQLSLLSELRAAAAGGQLEMWLQPKQCLSSGRTLGMEALVRWHHPERGYVSPAEFVPFAERTGNLGVITHAMIDAALQRLAQWQHALPDLTISVNVSITDVQEIALVQAIEQMAQRHRAPTERLRLEITESSVMEDADRVLPVLHALRGIGVQLSIDDFGTGYSSLAHLQRLPVSELKIDRSFVANADLDPDATALLKTIIDLGHSLQLCVTAEGIERAEEFSLLAELGCDLAQGYLIGRPMTPAVADDFFESLARAAQPTVTAAAADRRAQPPARTPSLVLAAAS